MALVAISNTLITPTIIAKEALMLLSNNMIMGRLVHKEYKNEFAKVGTSIKIRKPVKMASSTGATIATYGAVTEYQETFTVATQSKVHWGFTSTELTMTIDEYSKRYIRPATLALANVVDVALCSLYRGTGQSVGTPGVTPSAFSDFGDAQAVLDDAAAPMDGRVAVLNPAAHWAMADGLKGTFAQKPANDIHTKGYLGTVANLDIHMDQNIRRHLTGVFTTSATPLMSDTSTAGDVGLSTDGWNAAASTVTAGDSFTIGNSSATYVYSVNPVSGDSTGVLKRFSALNAETSSTSAIEIDIMQTGSEGLRASGAYKNVSALPASGSTINMIGTESTYYPQNLVFHPNAFGLVVMPLAMPAGVWGARVTDKQTGLSIRVVKDYVFALDQEVIRMDILYGTAQLFPDLGCRIWG